MKDRFIKIRPCIVELLDFIPNGERTMETYLQSLCEDLATDGWNVYLVVTGPPSARFAAFLQDYSIRHEVIHWPPSLAESVQLARRLRQLHPDVIHTHFVSKFSPLLLILKVFAMPQRIVLTDHSSWPYATRNRLKRIINRIRAKVVSTYINKIICVSDFNHERNIKDGFFPARQVMVIRNGVDVDRPPVSAFSPAQTQDLFRVCFVGQLIPQKGVTTLIQAIHALLNEGHRVRLRIAGDGPHREQLQNLVNTLQIQDAVSFLGHVRDVFSLMSESEVVVVPSLWGEAFGLVAAEAAATGACVVTSDAGALPEIINTMPNAGMVFRRGDVADLLDKLRYLIVHPTERQTMAANGRQNIRTHFSLQRMVGQYRQFFRQLRAQLTGQKPQRRA